ncbi:SDR family NAD(P)-dependent oxidoreductase [Vacuolonema iberomarrocanum]|uniref:SDR family NAD(P)-dependent oxidoreductase n=1 Tax=Vacuolonema iberomarrocanum TaxID=3454632 RepID=UPI0019E6D30C|nr:SDR family NAD(P)-dependent oxidoreductase [filamentous cyanobacterium LEGE 07170]
MGAASITRVLVTGGNRGIGFAIAQGLLAKGCEVVLTARSLDSAKQAAKELQGAVTPIALDISNDRSIRAAVETLRQTGDRLDVLINNAGVYPDDNVNILTISRDMLMTGMQTNTFGVIRMVQACLPFLEQSQDARVINMSSGMGALDGLTTTAPSYGLSKLALNGATLMLAQSLSSKGIVVNAMCPGWVQTDMGGASAPRSPEQGADTAIWLATEAPRSHNGKFFRDRNVISF